MRVENHEYETDRKFPLGPDVFEECQAVDEMPEVDPAAWQPLFHPNRFSEERGPLKVPDFKLSEEDLDQWK